jgi:phosphatidylglycerol lysyltransferase
VALALGVALATVYSFGGLLVLHRQLHHRLVIRHALRTSLRLVAFQHVHLHHAATPHVAWFVQSVPVLSAVALIYGIAMILRPAILRGAATAEDRERMRELVRTYGLNPLAPYALQEDKALFFTATRSAGLAYRVAGEVAVVLGDPIGPPGEVPAVLDEFLRFCQARGWHPAFYQVLLALAPLYRARGLRLMKIGEDAVLDLPTFTLSGKRMANVRHSVTHAERAGLHVHVCRLADVGEELRTQLAAISRAWLGGKMSAEMGFSMGTLGEVLDEETLVAVALDEQGTAWAFITLVPLPARRGWMLDLMRRRAAAPGGAMELLMARTAEYLRERGDQTFSLSLAPLASTQPSEEDTAAVIRRAREFLYEHFDHLYNYRSLQRFKDKFNPRWEERFLAYPTAVPLAMVIAAVVRVHFAPRPRATRFGRLIHGYSAPARVPA